MRKSRGFGLSAQIEMAGRFEHYEESLNEDELEMTLFSADKDMILFIVVSSNYDVMDKLFQIATKKDKTVGMILFRLGRSKFNKK